MCFIRVIALTFSMLLRDDVRISIKKTSQEQNPNEANKLQSNWYFIVDSCSGRTYHDAMAGSHVSTILYVSDNTDTKEVSRGLVCITVSLKREGTGVNVLTKINLLFKNIGIVVAPLHLDVCVVFCSDIFSSSFKMFDSDCTTDCPDDNIDSIGSCSDVVVALIAFVTTPVAVAPPPLRMRRRLVLNGPGKFNDKVVMVVNKFNATGTMESVWVAVDCRLSTIDLLSFANCCGHGANGRFWSRGSIEII